MRHTLIRIILSLVAVYDIYLEQMDVKIAVYDMYLEQMDVKTAFLHNDLQEDIVMAQPKGFIDSKISDWCVC